MPVKNDAISQSQIEAVVGHPKEKFEALLDRIQAEAIKTFTEVESDFLDMIWTLDAYRIAQVVPRGMANPLKPDLSPEKQLEGVYRGKGNYFSSVITHILGNMTTSRLASRNDVMGFSQPHQIDIAWPARDVKPLRDALICCEAKLTGAPAYPGNVERGGFADWSNRRKELKFQATDLKLYRKAANTQIDNWDLWRKTAPPSVYSLWAARLGAKDSISKMIEEARILTETYSNGVGIYAFQINEKGTGYTPSFLPKGVSGRVTSLDNVLGYIAADIRRIMRENHDAVPPPVIPPKHIASDDPS